MAVYERTKCRLFAPSRSRNDEEPTQPVTKQDILPNGSAFILRGLLSCEECHFYIKQAEDLGLYGCGYDPSIRRTDRVVAHSESLAELLFPRIAPYLEPIDLSDDGEINLSSIFATIGIPGYIERCKWNPVSLNECFRICRYQPGGFFLPHHDGGFRRSDDEQSLKTFMVYLNDNFEGGATHFYDDSQQRYTPGQAEKVIYRYHPQQGDAIVFNSAITHDGGTLTSGHKYILRSEVMYRSE